MLRADTSGDITFIIYIRYCVKCVCLHIHSLKPYKHPVKQLLSLLHFA